MNPGRVDVNVHPAKLEVKFSNEKIVFESVYYAVKQALEGSTARPQMQMSKPAGMKMSDSFVPVERGESLKARQISIDMQKPANPANSVSQSLPQAVKITPDTSNNKGFATARVDTQKVAPPEKMSAREYLKKYVNEIKNSENKKAAQTQRTVDIVADMQKITEEQRLTEEQRSQEPAVSTAPPHETAKIIPAPSVSEPTTDPTTAPDTLVTETPTLPWRLAGEVFNSYIIVEIGEKMLLVDKHAAHERIIFEKLKANMYSTDIASQLLMLPIEIMLMSDEVSTVEEYRAEIEAVGFEFTTSKNTVYVNALPVGIEQSAVADMFAVMADRIKNGTGNISVTRNILFEKALYQASCKAAIKAGREYTDADNKWIIDQLKAIPDITVCPHGRPVAMELSKKNIDRQFERT